jgi:hypothetical protein
MRLKIFILCHVKKDYMNFSFFFVVLGFELRVYTLSQPFLG